MDDASAEPRRSLRQIPGLTLQERLDLVWDAWITAHPAVAMALGIEPTAEDSLG